MLNFIEIRRLVEKLKVLEGGIFGKAYYFGDHFTFIVHKEGKNFLKFYPKKALFLSSFRISQEKIHPYSRILRKKLERRRIEEVRQIDNERAIEFMLKDGRVIFEIMPPGRLIIDDLCFDRGKIIKEFELAYGESIGIIERFEDFKNILKNSEKKDVIRALAIDLRLMGKYAEEIIFRTKINRRKRPNELSEEEIKKIFEEYTKVCQEILRSDKTYVYEKFVAFSKLSYIDGKEFDFWEGFDEFFKIKEKERKEEELERKIREIEEKMKEINRKIEEKMRIGEILKLNIDILEDAIRKEKEFLEIEGLRIEIDPRKTVWENIAKYFEEAKKLKKKLKGMKDAIEEIKKRLKKEKKEEVKIIVLKKEKKKWYEKFRWFVSSEGFLVVSGKDAITNDILIRKYMEKNDIVLHADIVGSPFTLIKNGKECSEKTIREAAQFTLAYSRAWKIGITVPVYYVFPEQIGLSPPPGQYMKRGSFMIYGKKNYVEDLKLEIAIGIKDNRIMSGPKEIFEKDFIILIPGRKKKSEVAKEIAKFFEKKGYKVDLNDLLSLIPGDSEIKL